MTRAVVGCAVGLLLSFAARATATPAASAEPPPGSLLAGARLSDSLDIRGDVGLVADNAAQPDGAAGQAGLGVRLLTAAASLTYDLGRRLPLAGFYAQVDAGHAYSLQASDDGVAFREIWKMPGGPGPEPRMRSVFMVFQGIEARYVRFGEPSGAGTALLTELQIFGRLDEGWPPRPRQAVAPPPSPPRRHPWFPPAGRAAAWVKIWLALGGAALLAWAEILRRRGAPGRFRHLRDSLLLLLGITGLAAYGNWGLPAAGSRIHHYEFFHYFVGAKYFPELGYSGLYECANLAEAEQGLRRRVERRTTRDLRTNELVPADYVLEDPERWKRGFARPFTPERWEEFKRDAGYFREHLEITRWETALKDHGYNPSPAWNLAGSTLANLAPATDSFVDALSWIDPVLLLAAVAAIGWAFGWRVACVAGLFLGTNALAEFGWIGGAFLRQDWLLWTVRAIAPGGGGGGGRGGGGLGIAALLRAFPVLFLVPVVLRLGWIVLRERRLDPFGTRILLGAAVAVAILVPGSSIVAGSARAWPAFFHNTVKHAETPLTNYVGLRTVLGFQWATRQKVLYEPGAVDPYHTFREVRRSVFQRNLFLWIAIVAGFLALLLHALRKSTEWWITATLGLGLIPMLLELTQYYFSFLLVAAFLGSERRSVPVALLLLAAVTHLVAFATYYYDVRFYFQGLVVVAFALGATWIMASGRRSAA
jgi:hypothetical protein